MAPWKEVKSLQLLTLSASSKLIYSSSKMIKDSSGNSTKAVRNHLSQYIPRIVWESLFESVMKLQQKSLDVDQTVLYSIFICEEVQLQKLRIGYKYDETDLATQMSSRQVELWLLQHLALLKSVVDVDLTKVQCNIIPAICKSTVDLEVVHLPASASPELMEAVIRSCKRLREIHCADQPIDVLCLALEVLDHLESISCPIDGNIFGSLDHTRKLKLRSLEIVNNVTAKNVQLASFLCPDLEDLSIKTNVNFNPLQRALRKSTDASIFRTLAVSALKLTKLNIGVFDVDSDAFHMFCTWKGLHLREFRIYCDRMSYPILAELAAKCPNLLIFALVSPPIHVSEDYNHPPDVVLNFPNLQGLTIYVWPGMRLARHCLGSAEQLTTLYLAIKEESYGVEDLRELLSIGQAKKLEVVFLVAITGEVTREQVELVCNSCPSLTTLNVGCVTDDAKKFLVEKCKEAKRINQNFTYASREI